MLIATILVSLSLHTQAQNVDKRTRIKYLFTLMKQDSLLLKQIDVSLASSRKTSDMVLKNAQVPMDSLMLKRLDVFTQKMIEKSRENALKLINEDMVEVYDQYFTLEEIEDFCTFYQTPAGRKLINNTSAIADDIAKRSATKYQPEIMKLLKEFMDESNRKIDFKYKN